MKSDSTQSLLLQLNSLKFVKHWHFW